LRILKGEVRPVIRGLRRMGTSARLRGKQRKQLDTICAYFEANEARMRYDQYLAEGYPIATGVIEGACRHLVKDRMEVRLVDPKPKRSWLQGMGPKPRGGNNQWLENLIPV
jgi:hypothetical protein